METITATELANGAAKYLKRAEAGESFTVNSRGSEVARLMPPDRTVYREVPWTRSASAGTPGSPVAADGRRHWRDFPCPNGPYKLSDDRRMWLEDYPPINLKTVDRILAAAFPSKRR